MNVLQVNLFDTTGGAARISWDLFRTYRQRGHQSYLAVGRKVSGHPDVFEIPNDAMRNPWSGFWWQVERRLTESRIRLLPGMARLFANMGEPRRWWDVQQGIEDFHFPGTARILDLAPGPREILHLHILHSGYFDLTLLPELSGRVPTVVTLHDEWMMTGHCAYTLGCRRFLTGCGSCPDLASYPPIKRDATAYNWQRKREIYRRSRLYVATPSRWLMDEVQASMLMNGVVDSRVIHNGVDPAQFHPGDQGAARHALGLPADARIALFVAHGARTSSFKDLPTVVAAFRELSAGAGERKLLFLCVGDSGEELRTGSCEFRNIAYVANEEEMANYYRAADVYLHAARLDNFPNSILEAMACGTPVVATAVGGIPEQVLDGETGFLVPAGDGSALAARVRQLLENEALRTAMRETSVARATRNFTLDAMADGYLSWYEEIRQRNLGR